MDEEEKPIKLRTRETEIASGSFGSLRLAPLPFPSVIFYLLSFLLQLFCFARYELEG